MSFVLPDLPFPYDALKPYLSVETLEYHHDKHHAAYVTTANNLLTDSGLTAKSLEDIVRQSHHVNVPLFNNAAQHYNHSEYWKSIKPDGGGKIPGKLEKALIETFGSIRPCLMSSISLSYGCGLGIKCAFRQVSSKRSAKRHSLSCVKHRN